MLRRFTIARHERGFLFAGDEYRRMLRPGAHWVWGVSRALRRKATTELVLQDAALDLILADPDVWSELVVADLRDGERGLVWVDGRIHDVLGPGRTAFWKGPRAVKVDVVPITPARFEHPLLPAILAAPGASKHLLDLAVPKGARGLLYLDDRFEAELGPGRYAFWKAAAKVQVDVVDLREAALEVAGQEILTADKVSLRLNVSATYRVTEPRAAVEGTANLTGALYRELQLALRAAVGSRTLDALLAAKDEVGRELEATVAPKAKALGAALGAVGIKDVILPGEMKTLLNQVIEAEKRAQANLIARREETAATRSLLNTAKLIEQSPTLLRLKELEAAERIAAAVGSVQVVGGGIDAVIAQLLPRGGAST
jgi:regulator of protease activity HflC (stomatin/prohibitin superfamily)